MTCRHGIALILSSETTEEYFLSFDIKNDLPNGYKIYEIPPSLYEVREFTPTHDRNGVDKGMEYGSKLREELNHSLKFNAEAGSVYNIGDYSGKTSCSCEYRTSCCQVSDLNNEFEAALKNMNNFEFHNVVNQ